FDTFAFLCLLTIGFMDSPLFPYTTLFRSQLDSQVDSVSLPPDQVFIAILECYRNFYRAARGVGRFVGNDGGISQHSSAFADGIRDRKSTRLNSSHVSISYAVFCLKKKMQ